MLGKCVSVFFSSSSVWINDCCVRYNIKRLTEPPNQHIGLAIHIYCYRLLMCIGILKFWMQFAVCYVFCVLLSLWIFAAVSFPSSIKQSASCQLPVHSSVISFHYNNNNNERHSTKTLIKYINSTLETFRLSVCCVNDHFGNEQLGHLIECIVHHKLHWHWLRLRFAFTFHIQQLWLCGFELFL